METAEQLLALLDQFVDAEPIQSLRANGVLVADDDTSLGRLYLCNQVGGYEILSVDGRIVTVFIYVLGQDGRTLFAGPLLADLPPSPTRDDVRRRFGRHPSRHSRVGPTKKRDSEPLWDRYDRANVSIHFQYMGIGELVRQITIMTPDTARNL